MIPALFYAAAGLAALAAILALLRQPSSVAHRRPSGTEREGEQFFPTHCRFFPQVQQALSTADETFLASRGSPLLVRKWQSARKQAVLAFLDALGEDFSRLDRLARTIARMAPEIDRQREAELFWLGVRFSLLSRLVRLRLRLGRTPREELKKLADLIGALGAEMDLAAGALVRDPSPGRAAPLSP